MKSIHIIAKESWKGIILFVIWLVFCELYDLSFGFLLGICGLLIWLWAFRNPERIPLEKENDTILAPIDGEITHIETQDKHTHITIKVGFLDSGFVRAPFHISDANIIKKSGLILYFSNLANRLNQKEYMENSDIKIALFPSVFKNTHLYAPITFSIGDRIGFMKFGELRLVLKQSPIHLRVNIGDKLKGGQTIIGYRNEH